MAVCSSSFDGELNADLVGLNRRWTFFIFLSLRNLTNLPRGFDGDPCLNIDDAGRRRPRPAGIRPS